MHEWPTACSQVSKQSESRVEGYAANVSLHPRSLLLTSLQQHASVQFSIDKYARASGNSICACAHSSRRVLIAVMLADVRYGTFGLA